MWKWTWKWTYSGIKRLYPELSFTEWLGICKREHNLFRDPYDVVIGVDWRKR
jgi:hypothetical protein